MSRTSIKEATSSEWDLTLKVKNDSLSPPRSNMQNVLDMMNTNDDEDDENERVMMIEVECNVFLRAEHTL